MKLKNMLETLITKNFDHLQICNAVGHLILETQATDENAISKFYDCQVSGWCPDTEDSFLVCLDPEDVECKNVLPEKRTKNMNDELLKLYFIYGWNILKQFKKERNHVIYGIKSGTDNLQSC